MSNSQVTYSPTVHNADDASEIATIVSNIAPKIREAMDKVEQVVYTGGFSCYVFVEPGQVKIFCRLMEAKKFRTFPTYACHPHTGRMEVLLSWPRK
jgi:hypothetical protein